MLVLALLLPLRQDLAQSIDYSTPPARVARILPALTEKTGIAFTASLPAKDDVLVIRVKDQPVSKLMEAIAEATSSTWQKEGKGYRLVENKELKAIEMKEEWQSEVALWKKRIDEAMKGWPARAAASPEDLVREIKRYSGLNLGSTAEDTHLKQRMVYGLRSRFPYGGLCARLVSALGPEWLASAPFGVTLYSNRPTVEEKKLPAVADALLARAEDDQAAFSQALRSASLAPEVTAASELWPEIQRNSNFKGPVRYLITLSIMQNYCEIQVLVNDAGNNFIASDSMTIGLAEAPTEVQSEEGKDDGVIHFTPRFLDYYAAVSKYMSSAELVLPAHIEKELADPERVDPVAFTAADGFPSFAEQAGLNLVVRVGDIVNAGLWRLTQPLLAGEKTVSRDAFVSFYRKDLKMRWREGGGWLIAKPERPHQDRRERIDRPSLGRLFEKARRQGFVSLDDVGAYCAEQPFGMPAFMGLNQLAFFLKATPSGMYGLYPLLRLYGSLSAQQKAALWSGGISYAGFSDSQKAMAKFAAFGQADRYPTVEKGVKRSGMTMHAQEIVPEGLTAATIFRGEYVAASGVLGRPQGNERNYANQHRVVDAKSYAFYEFLKEQPGRANSSEIPSFGGLCPVTIFDCELTLQLAPGVTLPHSVRTWEIPAGGAYGPFANLPEAFRSGVARELARLRSGGKEPPELR